MFYTTNQVENNSFRVNSINSNLKDSNGGSNKDSHDKEEFKEKLIIEEDLDQENDSNDEELKRVIFNDNNSFYMNISLVE
tara:strand:- start:542 stop:781 length:240 start_codon:yes stop_codon:yes gene_type:complete